MSNQNDQNLRFWIVVDDHLRRIRPHHISSKLSESDCAMFRDAVLFQGMVMNDILAFRSPERRPRLKRWCITTAETEISSLFAGLKVLTNFFRNYSENTVMSYPDFKHQNREISFLGDFLSPIKEEVVQFLLCPSPETFSIINEHLSLMSRLTFTSVDFTQKCMSDYIDTERRLQILELDPTLVASLNGIVKEWFHDFKFEGFKPSHGPGGVAKLSRCSLKRKYLDLTSDPILDYFLKRVDYSPDVWGSPTPLDRACEIVFVPKTSSSFRTISMEPATLMYYQQGVWDQLDRYLRGQPTLRKHVFLHDSNVNKEAARECSVRPRRMATVDLSAASDSVSWELVKNVFKGTTLLAACYATRSRWAILPNGERLPLRKFAPMGSAMCFPVECIVFAAICEYVARQKTGSSNSRYLVYGDDIVIENHLVDNLYEVLSRLGFIVNHQKSFHRVDLPFRESCGGEFYNGVDVTPFRLSRNFSSTTPSVASPKAFAAYVSLCNSLYMHNCSTARRFALLRLLSLPQKLRPIFSDDEKHLISPCPTNFHLKVKTYRAWQADYFQHGIVKTVDVEEESEPQEDIRLFEWLRSAHGRIKSCYTPEDVIRSAIGETVLKLATGITPV